MKIRYLEKNDIRDNKFGVRGIIFSILIFTIMFGCMVVAVRDAFRPGLTWIVGNCSVIKCVVECIRACVVYSWIQNVVGWICAKVFFSEEVIGLIGLSGTAIQILSDVNVDRYPGLERRIVFRWRYPGYKLLYVIHIFLMFFGVYAAEHALGRCAIFCEIGLLTSFFYSAWIMLKTVVSHRKEKFIESYVKNKVKSYKNVRISQTGDEIKQCNDLLYRAPVVKTGSKESVSSLSRRFENVIRGNAELWKGLLGGYSSDTRAQQVDACSLILRTVTEVNKGDTRCLPTFFACGLLLWLHYGIPQELSNGERWKQITLFLADISGNMYSNQKDRRKSFDGIAFGYSNVETAATEEAMAMVAMNLLYIEDILWKPLTEEKLSECAELLKRVVCQNRIKPQFSPELREHFLVSALMVYQCISCYVCDYTIIPSRKDIPGLLEYVRKSTPL